MNEDLIKRGDAIKAIEAEECLGYVECQSEWLYDRINAIPSADRPQEWIPCGERLPEEKEAVAVIIKQWDTGEIKKGITYRVDRNMWVGFGRYNEACVWWLPLPPWKGADDE